MKHFLSHITASAELHAKWLNTLSFLENCGARFIASCEHPTQVKEEMLKHASEEFRHAHHLKLQIKKLNVPVPPSYGLSEILGGMASLHYLNKLNLYACKYLIRYLALSKGETKALAYLLVTYAIELRAEKLYPLYDEILRLQGSKVTVKSILMEEKEHLAEMRKELSLVPSGMKHAEVICGLEEALYESWSAQLVKELCVV